MPAEGAQQEDGPAEAASLSTACACRQEGDDEPESLTRLVAPIFAGFSLPTIFVFVSSSGLAGWAHIVVLSLLLAATGLFMASIQLSIGRLHDKYGASLDFREFRATLAIVGIVLVASALTVLVAAQTSGWIWISLTVLIVGGLGPAVQMLRVGRVTPSGAATKKQGATARADQGGG